jgi:hypothetical protein
MTNYRYEILNSKATKYRIQSCMQIISATQSLFEIKLANEVNATDSPAP